MKQQFRSLPGSLNKPIPLSTLVGLTRKRILLPFYHTVSDKRLPHISNLYSLRNTELFIQDLEFYLKHFRPVSMEELQHIIVSGKQPEKPVFHLTFDDGLKELYTTIAPILEQKGITATVFLNTAFIDNKALFYRYKVSLLIDALKELTEPATLKQVANILRPPVVSEEAVSKQLLNLTYQDQSTIDAMATSLQVDFAAFLQNEQPYLTSTEIADLIKRGFTFGSHSIDHPHFNSIPLEEQKRQIRDSFDFLYQKFGITDRYFSFPFSDDGVSLQLLKWLHNEAGCTLSFGISGLKEDFSNCHLHRIPMEGNHMPASHLIKSEYLYYMVKAVLFKNKISRK